MDPAASPVGVRTRAFRVVLTAMLAAAASSPLGAQAPGKPEPASREARVLALLHRVPTQHGQLPATAVVATTNAYGARLVTPDVGGVCGNGWEPAFDPTLARSLAAELFAIYDLAPVANAPAPAGQAAVLDVFDARKGIALKLRGRVENKALPAGGVWPTVVDEPAATDLDVDEHRALAAANVRVHVADVQAFWVAAAGDRLTTTLCYLASVAAFLDDVTDGEDVDCSALVPHRSRWLPFDAPRARAGLAVVPWAGGCTLVADRASDVRLAIDPARATAPKTGERAGPLANGGRPVTLQLVGLQAERGAFVVTLRQAGKDGRERELAASRTPVLFAPGAFDASRPFVLVLALQPGQYRIDTSAWLSAPAGSPR